MVISRNLSTRAGYLKMKARKWTIKEQADFLKKTGELLERGYPLADAVHSLTYQMKKNRKEEIIHALTDLKEGHPFHKVLLDLEFHQTLVGFVYFAEQHGSLATAFQEGSSMMLKRNLDLQKLKKLVVYPFFLILTTLFLFLFVERVLLPRFTALFQSMKLAPNAFIGFVSLTGKLFPYVILVVLIIGLAAVMLYYFKFRNLSPIKKRTILATLPLYGPFYRLLLTHYFAIQLGFLLGGGLSILEALKLFEQHVKYAFDRELGYEIQSSLASGQALEKILSKYLFFEKELSVIVKHGQENGKLDQELLFFSKHCLTRLEEKTERVFKTIQPILYSIIGLIIVGMYLAILLPMFQLLDGI